MSDSGFSELRRHQWYGKPGESHYIPSWYEPHTDLSLPVRCDGKDQGFRIGDMPPFRRWAVDEKGNALQQHEFAEKHLLYIDGFKHDATLDVNKEAVPNVAVFIRQKLDKNGHLVDITYVDDGRVVKSEKFTQDGTVAPEWIAKNTEQADKLSKIQTLTDLLKEGIITQEQYTAKTSAILGPQAAILAKEEPKPERKKFKMSEEHKAALAAGRAKRAAERAAEAAAP